MRENIYAGNDSVCSNRRIEALIREYIADVSYRRYSSRTVDTYGRALMDFADYLAKEGVQDLPSVTCGNIEAYRLHIMGRGFEEASMEVYMRSVKRLFRWLAAGQRIFVNPAEAIGPMSRSAKLMPVPSEEEIASLLAAPDTGKPIGIRDRAILEVAYSTAARREELASMKIGDVDMEHGTLLIKGKGGRQRMVPVGSEALRWVKRYIAEVRGSLARSVHETRLWIGSRREPLGKEGIAMIIRVHSIAAGTYPGTGPHCIRRACATHMLLHGASPVQIQMMLGHASMRHLSQYLRLTIREIREMHGRSVLGQ